MATYYRLNDPAVGEPWGVERLDGTPVAADMNWSRKHAEMMKTRMNEEAARLVGDERARLRPLLERCLRIVDHYDGKLPLSADLRRELGLPED